MAVIAATRNALDQRTYRGRRKEEIPQRSRLPDTSYFSSSNPRNASLGMPEIPRSAREMENDPVRVERSRVAVPAKSGFNLPNAHKARK